MLQERLTTSEVFCDEQHVNIKVNYTSLSPWTSLGTIGSVSDGSFLSIAAPRRQALKYFFWTWADGKKCHFIVSITISNISRQKKPHFYWRKIFSKNILLSSYVTYLSEIFNLSSDGHLRHYKLKIIWDLSLSLND